MAPALTSNLQTKRNFGSKPQQGGVGIGARYYEDHTVSLS